jgi:hypothetical protein
VFILGKSNLSVFLLVLVPGDGVSEPFLSPKLSVTGAFAGKFVADAAVSRAHSSFHPKGSRSQLYKSTLCGALHLQVIGLTIESRIWS